MCVNIECLRHILMLNCFTFVSCGFFGGVRFKCMLMLNCRYIF